MAKVDDFSIEDREVESFDEGIDAADEGPDALFGPNSLENMPTKEDRVFRKAKRSLIKGGVMLEDGSVSAAKNGVPFSDGSPTSSGVRSKTGVLMYSKNSRKSRNQPHGRGQPKKGGAGGKGVWGKPGMELEETGECSDIHDPNYDSDSQEAYKLEKVVPDLTDEQLDNTVKPILQEYLEHGNTSEVEALIAQLNIGTNRHRIARLAVTLAMDRHNPQREMISRLISDLYSGIFSQDDIARCFDELLSSIDDIRLDTPDAHNLIGQFIARCIADDCLPPKFITGYKGKINNEFIKTALEKAEVLLSMNHGIAHLDNIWGVGGGNRPVKYLSNKIDDLLKEYVNSGDKNEAMRCLQELDVPHFHHELVYQACDMAIEDSSERVMDLLADLLQFFSQTNVIPVDQLEKGLYRLFNDIHDINLDVPAAYSLLEQLVGKLRARHVVTEAMLKDMPSRGRKRFVSEGDGGRLKSDAF